MVVRSCAPTSWKYRNQQLACVVATFIFILAIVVQTPPVCAQGLRGVINDLIRGTARVADEVPVKRVDGLVTELSKSRAAREAVDTELRSAGRLTDTGDVLRGTARSDEVLRLLRTATSELDPRVIRRLEQLDGPSRDAALLLARGGNELSRTVPDLASRGRLIRGGGPETVAAVGMFGRDAARAALKLDEAIKGGSLVSKNGSRAVTVADFGNVMTRYGDASWNFWKEYIRPHWKIWAASGALAAYLSDPEYFQDATGRLTEAGFRHLTEFIGETAAATIRGVGEGSGNASKKVAEATWETFISTKNGMYSIIGTIIFLFGLSLFFHRVRYWVLCPLRWLNKSPGDVKPNEFYVQEDAK